MTPDWKPIESAPKDGRRIMIAFYDRSFIKKEVWVDFAKWQPQDGHDRPRPYWAYESIKSVTWCRSLVPIAWDDAPPPPTLESLREIYQEEMPCTPA